MSEKIQDIDDEAKKWRGKGMTVGVKGTLTNAKSVKDVYDKIMSPTTYAAWRTQKGIKANLVAPYMNEPLKEGEKFKFGVAIFSFICTFTEATGTAPLDDDEYAVLTIESSGGFLFGLAKGYIRFEVYKEKDSGNIILKAFENQAGVVKPPAKDARAANILLIHDMNASFA